MYLCAEYLMHERKEINTRKEECSSVKDLKTVSRMAKIIIFSLKEIFIENDVQKAIIGICRCYQGNKDVISKAHRFT